MAKTDIVTIGASAGGVEALSTLVRHLPESLDAAVFVVLHFPETSTSVLPRILAREGRLEATQAVDGERIQKGHIYTAQPGRHLLVKRGYLRVTDGPKENTHRPSIDPLFRTAAKSYGPRVASVLLSGLLDDGVLGMAYVKRLGGTALVQDPDEALFGALPRNAIHQVQVDRVLRLEELAEALIELACQPDEEDPSQPPPFADFIDPTEMSMDELRDLERPAPPSEFTCPECHGTLFEMPEHGIPHFRCRVGHAYSAESLRAHQDDEVEAALWEALKSLEENLALCRRLMERALARGHDASVKHYSERVESGQRRVDLLRRVLISQTKEIAS